MFLVSTVFGSELSIFMSFATSLLGAPRDGFDKYPRMVALILLGNN